MTAQRAFTHAVWKDCRDKMSHSALGRKFHRAGALASKAFFKLPVDHTIGHKGLGNGESCKTEQGEDAPRTPDNCIC